MAKSVYIHIPFCKSKCKYCSFISYADTAKISEYILALEKEIKNYYQKENLKTLYFGGGTPSLISSQNLNKIIKLFNLAPECEITLEINPDDASKDYLQSVFDIGVNRLSIGSQSFNDEILKLIARRHSAQDIINTVNLAQKIGFKNISVDLIYGLPNQNFEKIKFDLNIIKNLDIQHVSTYGLKIEEGSYFYKHIPQNLPNDDEQADFYEFINDFLENNGFKRYEISNFAKNGFESKHNLNYWNNENYYGFGVASHGYENDTRYNHTILVDEYINNPLQRFNQKVLTKKEQLEEEIFLGFRKTAGIDVQKIWEKFSIDFEEKYSKILKKYQGEYIKKTDLGYRLTLKGSMLSNIILAEFI